MRRTILAAIIATTLPQFAAAEGFSSEDLGSIANDAACVDGARRVFETYKGEVAAGNISTGTWTAALYDIDTDDYDPIVLCTYGPDGATRASVVVYSDDNTDRDTRRGMALRTKQIWKEMF